MFSTSRLYRMRYPGSARLVSPLYFSQITFATHHPQSIVRTSSSTRTSPCQPCPFRQTITTTTTYHVLPSLRPTVSPDHRQARQARAAPLDLDRRRCALDQLFDRGCWALRESPASFIRSGSVRFGSSFGLVVFWLFSNRD